MKLKTKLTLKSYAKVNLFFRVFSKRPDGYHDIASLMQRAPLFDLIEIELSDRDAFFCPNHLPSDGRNLAIAARNLFRQTVSIPFSATITLTKNIPIMAGLGGGSSNAATVLMGLNTLLGSPLSNRDLITLGAKLGSDVPFFFSKTPAYVRGRGEILEPIDFTPLPITLFSPPFGLSTKEVFTHHQVTPGPDPDRLVEGFLNGAPQLINDLEKTSFALEPRLKAFKEGIETPSPSHVVMTGSGSTFLRINHTP